MDQTLYVLAILGCGDGETACLQQRLEPVRYTSIQACQAAMPAALRRNGDLDFPVISAACQRQSQEMARQDAARPRG
jgi:hypothetical protein